MIIIIIITIIVYRSLSTMQFDVIVSVIGCCPVV